MFTLRKVCLVALLAAGFSCELFAATSGLNPSRLKLKVYKVAVSTSEFCTNPITIFEEANPDYTDFLGNPTLGSGSLANNTYNCLIFEFDSVIKPTPSSTSDNNGCVTNTEFDLDVCQSGTTATLIDGTTVNCGSGSERIAMYLSTASTETTGSPGHNAFTPPTSAADNMHGFNLANGLVINGSTSGAFVVNGNGKIEEQNCPGVSCACEFQPPLFSFR